MASNEEQNTSGSLPIVTEQPDTTPLIKLKNGYMWPGRIRNHHVGNTWRAFHVYVKDSVVAQFVAKLKYDNYKQASFFEKIIEAYLEDNPTLRKLMEEMNPDQSIRRKKNRAKDEEDRQKIIKDFGLNEDEIESIFDDIKNENGDL